MHIFFFFFACSKMTSFFTANWRMESIRRDSDSSGSDEEFFDCQGEFFMLDFCDRLISSIPIFICTILGVVHTSININGSD